jgi:predicted metal-dependent peptidase
MQAHSVKPLTNAIIQLVMEEAFFGHVLQNLSRQMTTDVPTAAVRLVGPAIELLVNPHFFNETLSTKHRQGVLKHEVLHIVYRHLFRRSLYDRVPHLVYNIAADIVVNQYIDEEYLPEDALLPESFPDLDLDWSRSLDYYIEKLMSEKGEAAMESLGIESVGAHVFWDEAETEEHAMDAQMASYALDRIVVNAFDRATREKSIGKLPADLIRQIGEIRKSQKPLLNWRRALRVMAESAKSTRVTMTYKRVSKRFGYRPGVSIRRRNRLLVAIDTSGSISNRDLVAFFEEIYHIWKAGASILVLECDAMVQQFYEYKGRPNLNLKGGGGTSFDPVFEWMLASKNPFDGCIYFTDGYVNKPTIHCPAKLIYVVRGDNDNLNHLKPGIIIPMKS